LIPFGFTHCIYSSNPSSPLNLARDEALSKKHNLKSVRRVDLDELARESDVLFVLAPGGASTHHLVNETFLEKMKKTSVLVNSSRGTLVDSEALAKALRDGQIWAAGVDVVEGEPNITTDHPLVKEPRSRVCLLINPSQSDACHRCCILPHIGSATVETRLGMATLAAKNVLAGVYGEALPAGLDIV
jgi:glyoxylate/hydroxypyruvate reductase